MNGLFAGLLGWLFGNQAKNMKPVRPPSRTPAGISFVDPVKKRGPNFKYHVIDNFLRRSGRSNVEEIVAEIAYQDFLRENEPKPWEVP